MPSPFRFAALAFGFGACLVWCGAGWAAASAQPVERLEIRVLQTFPHDAAAYTQGLLWHEGGLYESTGHYGQSRLRRVDLESGGVEQERALAESEFGEGLARVDDTLVQLTWKAGLARVYDIASFEPIGTRTYTGEGWGLCYDGAGLVMSNGTAELVWREPESFVELERRTVTLNGEPVSNLNELECAEGWIYANVYSTTYVVRIDPASGAVTALIDGGRLVVGPGERGDVMNGIAYRPETQTFFLTGKYWSELYEVEFVPQQD